MEDQQQQTSTPLAQLRAQAAAAKQAESGGAPPVETAPPVVAPPPVPPPTQAQAQAPAPPAPAPAPAPIPSPAPAPTPAPSPAVPASPEDAIAELAAASPPLNHVAKPAAKKPSSGGILSLLNPAALKMGVAVMLIFIVVSGLPVEAITSRFAFLKKIPCSSTTIKAITAGAAAAAVSTSVAKISP